MTYGYSTPLGSTQPEVAPCKYGRIHLCVYTNVYIYTHIYVYIYIYIYIFM